MEKDVCRIEKYGKGEEVIYVRSPPGNLDMESDMDAVNVGKREFDIETWKISLFWGQLWKLSFQPLLE